MSALALKGQKHRWYCICAICIWLNILITMVDSWVNNIQAECTQLVQNTRVTIYTSKRAWLHLILHIIQRSSTLQYNIWRPWKWVCGCFQTTHTRCSYLHTRLQLMLSLLYWLHWFCRLITMFFFFCCCCFFPPILRFTWKQLITFNNKLKWWSQ